MYTPPFLLSQLPCLYSAPLPVLIRIASWMPGSHCSAAPLKEPLMCLAEPKEDRNRQSSGDLQLNLTEPAWSHQCFLDSGWQVGAEMIRQNRNLEPKSFEKVMIKQTGLLLKQCSAGTSNRQRVAKHLKYVYENLQEISIVTSMWMQNPVEACQLQVNCTSLRILNALRRCHTDVRLMLLTQFVYGTDNLTIRCFAFK